MSNVGINSIPFNEGGTGGRTDGVCLVAFGTILFPFYFDDPFSPASSAGGHVLSVARASLS